MGPDRDRTRDHWQSDTHLCLAQGHNAVAPLGLEPAAPRSRVEHSTTEPHIFTLRLAHTKNDP